MPLIAQIIFIKNFLILSIKVLWFFSVILILAASSCALKGLNDKYDSLIEGAFPLVVSTIYHDS